MEGIKDKLDKDKLGFKNTKAAKDRIAELKVEAGKLSHQITKLGEKPYLSAAQKKQLSDLRGQLAEAKTALEELNTAHEKATKGILFDMLQQRLDSSGMLDVNADPNNQANVDLLQNLAVKWGLVDQATADAMQAANEASGIIDTAGQSAETAAGRVDTYYAAWNALNDLGQVKNFMINVGVAYSEQQGVFGNGTPDNYGVNAGEQDTLGGRGNHTPTPPKKPTAGGGPVFNGKGYRWNEPTARPEILIPTGNGFVLNRQQAQEALAMATRGPQMAGGLSIAPGAIQIVAAPGMSTNAIADTIMLKVKKEYGVLGKMRSKGQR